VFWTYVVNVSKARNTRPHEKKRQCHLVVNHSLTQSSPSYCNSSLTASWKHIIESSCDHRNLMERRRKSGKHTRNDSSVVLSALTEGYTCAGIYRKTCPSNLNPENMKAIGGCRRNLSPTGERTLSLANDQHTSTDTCLYADVGLLTFKDMKSFIAWTWSWTKDFLTLVLHGHVPRESAQLANHVRIMRKSATR
jgi:hypothetical protein